MHEVARTYSRGLSRTEERQQSRELGVIDHYADLAEHEVRGINRVTQLALFETMRTAEMRKVAENMAPDGAELYAMIAVAGAMESARVISSMSQPRRYR